MKYYFISYQWSSDGGRTWVTENEVSAISPMVWLEQTFKFSEAYKIEFYSEITQHEYEMLKDKLC